MGITHTNHQPTLSKMLYGLLKQNFSLGDFVTIGNTGGDTSLEGQPGRILGKAMETAECDFYIVLLSVPQRDRAAIVITETCLAKNPKGSGFFSN